MNKIRKFLYLVFMAMAIAAIAVFASACGDKEKAPATKYTLKFMNGTAVYDTVTATAGSTVEYKPDPSRANLVFDGWSLSENGEVVELPEKMPAEDRTYYAVFSARYKVRLNVGECGTIPAESAELTVKSGVKLYDIVAGITPTVSGDATFGAWFYNGVELTAQSATLMPTVDITLEAKYTVSYELNEYKQLKYGENTYSDVNKVSGTGYVGDYVVISNHTGYEYYETEENDGDKAVTVPLSASKSANTYNIYYNLRAYNVIFNANMPKDVTVSGTMDNALWGYNEQNVVPQCLYSATGYRFIGWSDRSEGKAKYFEGDKLSVTRATVLYAIWSKGYTDAIGQSSDYIFVVENAEGNNEVYLRRSYIKDMKGEFNAVNNTFVFKNDSNQVILRGIVYPETETYTYLDTQSQTTYVLNERKGVIGADGYVTVSDTVSRDVTLVVKENGDLVYNDGTAAHNGTLSFDQESESMVFDGGEDCTFVFRLATRTVNDELVPVFERRDETMYGVRYGLNQNGTLDATTYIDFDGYGGVVMYVIGYKSLVRSKDTLVVSSAGGYYAKLTDGGRADICVSLFKNDYVRTTYLALIDSDKNLGDKDNPVYKVFAERLLDKTVYAKPETEVGENFQWADYIQNADTARITLDGFGMFDNSAVYTYKDGTGEQKTISGKYVIDTGVNELVLITAEKNYLFLLSYVTTDAESKTVEILFTVADEMTYTSRPIIGLDAQNLNLMYRFRLIDGENAEFAFALPIADQFFGIYEYSLQLQTAFGGKYVEVGKDEDSKKVYEFTAGAGLTDDLIQYIFANYYYAMQKGLDISVFRQFKFISTTGYLSDGSTLDCFATKGIYDGYKGVTLKYDGVTYTLDGYGIAVPADASVANKAYSISSNFGIATILALEVSPKVGTTAAVIKEYMQITENGVKTFKLINAHYNTVNGKYMFRVVMLEDGFAAVGSHNSSARKFEFYSFGTLSETDGLYTYTETESNTVNGIPLLSVYGDFSFRITQEQGTSVGYIYIQDKLQETLDVPNVGTLTIDKEKVKATFTDKDGKEYSGTYRLFEDILEIVYTVPAEGETAAKSMVKSLKLIYDGGAITSFKEIGNEAGTWWNYEQTTDKIVLSGDYDGEMEIDSYDKDGNPIKKTVKTAKAIWTYSNDEEQPVTVNGKYYRTDNAMNIEYCFVYNNGTADVEKPFTTAYTVINKPLFKFRSENVAFLSAIYGSVSDEKPIAQLISDGYFISQLVLGANQALPGVVTIHEEEGIVAFAVNSSTVFYFGFFPTSQTSGKWVLLDETITDPNLGTFKCVEGNELEIDGGKVTHVRFTGYGVAWMYTGVAESDPQGVFYSTVGNTYFLYNFDENDKIVIISAISLRIRNNGENADDYIILFADKDLYDLSIQGNMFVMNNSFTNSNNHVLVFDGYSSAVYIDGKGVRRSAVYAKVENPVAGDDSIIVQVIYVGDNGYEMIVVAIKDGEFTVLAEDDPRYPRPSEGEPQAQSSLPLAA